MTVHTERKRRKPRLVKDYWHKPNPVYACGLYYRACPHDFQCETCESRRSSKRDAAALEEQLRQLELSAQAQAELLLREKTAAKYAPQDDAEPPKPLTFIQEAIFARKAWWVF